ncbi:MAG: NAD(P)H-hydrate dehydratase [Opitutus sp.]|nr:NAD(P)H-hydrate dehydratase [Opitutus sp.]
MNSWAHPVLSCEETRALEARLFGGDEAKEWPAMQRAGRAIADAVLLDFQEIGGFPATGRILVLVGKGHNGGDALLAVHAILERYPAATADVVFAFGERALRPLARRAWQDLAHAVGERGQIGSSGELNAATGDYALCLDGVFGFQFHPPMPAEVAALFATVKARSIRLRAAVDLPSGLHEESARNDAVLAADFTYATGSVKTPVVNGTNAEWVGRLRYLDLGFFDQDVPPSRLRILTPAVLAPLGRLRSPVADKRDFGHVLVLGGSRDYPGAVLMTVQAALRSGAGLVTAFVPESLAPAFAARAPEAMWVGWPETPIGGLAVEGIFLLRRRLEKAGALVIGPGLGSETETLALIMEVVRTAMVPLVLDADALQADIVRVGTAPRVLTPHLGELRRILEPGDFYRTPAGSAAIVVVKGRLTGVTTGGRAGYYSLFGGPVLARGGSGDLLAGITGTMLAQSKGDLLLAASRGVVWHGLAADALARAHGQVAVSTTQLLDFLPATLRAAAE